MATSPAVERQCAQQLRRETEECDRWVQVTRRFLDRLREMKTNYDSEGTGGGEVQMCGNVCATGTRRFQQALRCYMVAQENYRDEVRGKVRRQLEIIYPEGLSEEELDRMANAGGQAG